MPLNLDDIYKEKIERLSNAPLVNVAGGKEANIFAKSKITLAEVNLMMMVRLVHEGHHCNGLMEKARTDLTHAYQGVGFGPESIDMMSAFSRNATILLTNEAMNEGIHVENPPHVKNILFLDHVYEGFAEQVRKLKPINPEKALEVYRRILAITVLEGEGYDLKDLHTMVSNALHKGAVINATGKHLYTMRDDIKRAVDSIKARIEYGNAMRRSGRE